MIFTKKPKVSTMSRGYTAFTLAEVLITLAIIGVVAAMTIPTLLANYQKTQYVTQLKKAYSEINQALTQVATDHGCVGDLKCTGLFDTDTTNQSLGTELVKYFKVIKNCESSDGPEEIYGCFSSSESDFLDDSMRDANWLDSSNLYRFVIEDGMSFAIDNYHNNCTQNRCGGLYVDVNGQKSPNIMGRDDFIFLIRSNGLYPVGGQEDDTYGPWDSTPPPNSNCSQANPNGMYCAGRVIEENWQMNY